MPSRREPAAPADPLKPARLFARLASRRGLVLAVSGGSDSTALMVLAAAWGERPPALVVSVDHGLRPEAAAEARLVAENAARLELPWRIMTAPERSEGGNLQDWARRIRYALLAEAACEAGFDTIVTAHHREDQAETFLLRLARGSGVYGLSAMAEETTIGDVAISRPLLAVPRATLRDIAAESGLPTVDDPGNSDPRFDRVRMRNALPALAGIGLTPERLAETAGRLARAAAALDHYSDALARDCFAADPFGVVRGEAAALASVPEEVALRTLARLLRAAGGGDYTPPLRSVEGLLAAILGAGPEHRLGRTLAGVVVSLAGGTVSMRREWGRSGLAAMPAPAGAHLLWDRRFAVAVPKLAGALTVGPLAAARRPFRAAGRTDSAALRTLPALYRDGALLAVPGLVMPADDGPRPGLLEVECVVARRIAAAAGNGLLSR